MNLTVRHCGGPFNELGRIDEKSILPAGKRNPIPRTANAKHSHYKDRAITATKICVIRTRGVVRSLLLLEPTTTVLFLEEGAMYRWALLLSPLNKPQLTSNHCGRTENICGL